MSDGIDDSILGFFKRRAHPQNKEDAEASALEGIDLETLDYYIDPAVERCLKYALKHNVGTAEEVVKAAQIYLDYLTKLDAGIDFDDSHSPDLGGF